jgi:hypothetical protein
MELEPKVAAAMELEPEVVAAYAGLFFNVIDRREEVAYVYWVVECLKSGSDEWSRRSVPKDCNWLFGAARDLRLRGVLEWMGRALPEKEVEAGKEADGFSDDLLRLRMIQANRWILLSGIDGGPGGLAFGKEIEILLKFEAAWAKWLQDNRYAPLYNSDFVQAVRLFDGPQDDASEPDPDGAQDPEESAGGSGADALESPEPPADIDSTLESAPMTGDEIRRLFALFPSSTPALGGLHLPWDSRQGGNQWHRKTPQETLRPDFAFEFATRWAERDDSDPLPEGDAFHWIRMAVDLLRQERQGMSEGGDETGTDQRGLQLVREAHDLHQRSWARHFLQAALIARDSTTSDVADWMDLEDGVVDAYAALFFNVVGRRREHGFLNGVRKSLERGIDPAGDAPIPKSHLRLLRAAPRLSLAQLKAVTGGAAAESTTVQVALDLLRTYHEFTRMPISDSSPGGGGRRGLPPEVEGAMKSAGELLKRRGGELTEPALTGIFALIKDDLEAAVGEAMRQTEAQIREDAGHTVESEETEEGKT